MKFILVVVVVLITLTIGAAIGFNFKPEIKEVIQAASVPIELEGYVKLDVDIQGTNIRLTNNCRRISFDVTADQAFSIAKALEKTTSPRPLPHDIFSETLDNFEIKLINAKIDRYENGIYFARMIFLSGERALEIDARPSDTIATSIRQKIPLYIDEDILNNQGTIVC